MHKDLYFTRSYLSTQSKSNEGFVELGSNTSTSPLHLLATSSFSSI